MKNVHFGESTNHPFRDFPSILYHVIWETWLMAFLEIFYDSQIHKQIVFQASSLQALPAAQL